MKLDFLRKNYPKFVYENYEYKISGRNLEIFFDFKIGSNISFNPKIIIENIDRKRLSAIGDNVLKNLVFNIGLMEMLSYWKTTCSPEIEIKTGYLNQDQSEWWENLIKEGMGQFFYENRIDWRKKDFINIVSFGKESKVYGKNLKNRYLVPFAGGRDSIVTLEELKNRYGKQKISLFTVNTIKKIQKTVKVSGIKKQIIVKRIIDKKLLKLNKEGYLNGHTPFTALLSFISVLCAVIFDYKNISFSNEKSSNEGNVKYLDRMINHQWAKSSEFEKMFSDYCRKYLAKNINYFSFVRKYTELEVSKMITKYPKYFSVFSSCNAGMKVTSKGTLHAKERWCGNCPKCLFVYLSLFSFLDEKNLNMIFGKDIFENRNLLPIMKGLTGQGNMKPFECVGTKEETSRALNLCLKKLGKNSLPYLLNYFKNNK